MRLTEEHRAIRDTMTRFVETEVNPHADAWEEAGIWPAHEILGKLGCLGLLGINKPEEFGGQNMPYILGTAVGEMFSVVVLLGRGSTPRRSLPSRARRR